KRSPGASPLRRWADATVVARASRRSQDAREKVATLGDDGCERIAPQRVKRLAMLRIASLVIAPVLLAIVAGCTPPAVLTPEPPKVGGLHPEKRELTDQETFNGWLDARETLEVRSRVRGHIQKVYFTDGQMIDKGKPLFDLDPRPFQTEIDKSNEKLKIYQAQLVAAEKEEDRLKELLKIGGASKQQTEKAEA